MKHFLLALAVTGGLFFVTAAFHLSLCLFCEINSALVMSLSKLNDGR